MTKQTLRLRRLGWAGVEIEYAGETLLIDYVQDTAPLAQLRSPNEPFPESTGQGTAIAALITHLHADHADPSALTTALRPGAPVLRPEAATGTEADLILTEHAEKQFQTYNLATEIVGAWTERNIGPFRVSSAPAVDGFGDIQISWMIECGGRRIFHAGDTIFHSYWWRIVNRFGPIDIAFLPINGPVINIPILQPPSPIEAVMTPEQAAIAAHILQATYLVPIHYHSLHKPPGYIETPGALTRLRAHITNLKIQLLVKEPGEWFVIQ